MLGMVVHAEISAPSIAFFIRGTHETGNFVELLAQYQYESQTQNPDKRFWTFHGCIFKRDRMNGGSKTGSLEHCSHLLGKKEHHVRVSEVGGQLVDSSLLLYL